MIVFVDGPDGSGKTTLVSGLHRELLRAGHNAVLAPALWKFIDEIDRPEAFAEWVIGRPGFEVAGALIHAMSARLLWLKESTDRRRIGDIVLVDRGVRTVICSARAHIQGGDGTELPAGLVSLNEQATCLANQLPALAAAEPCLGVEIRMPSPSIAFDLITERLTKREELSPQYLRYLQCLCVELSMNTDSSIPSVVVDGRCAAESLVRSTMTYIGERGVPAIVARRGEH